MSNTTNRQASVDSRRIALEREVSIRVPRFDTFVTEYSSNISTTGMYIVSEDPQPPGTTFSFEFSVADDWKLIRGKAQVVWTRYRDEGAERPPGMGVRFLELDAQSRRLIRWIVEKHIREGGKPFELDELRSVIDQALEQVLDTDEIPEAGRQVASSSVSRPTSKPAVSVRNAATVTTAARSEERRLLPLLLTAAGVLAIVGLLFWLTEWLPARKVERSVATDQETVTGVEPASGGEGASETAAETTVETVQAAAPPPAPEPTSSSSGAGAEVTRPEPSVAAVDRQPPPVGSAYKSVLDSVTAWANAWSSQDADAYLSHYADEFSPSGGGLSRRQWEAQRRERLRAPDFIKVSISGLEFERLDDRRARVVFTQSYRSNRFSDMVEKTMDLVWQDGRWRIAREESR